MNTIHKTTLKLLKLNKKKCPKCNKIKDISSFYKSSSRKCGYDCYCKKCDYEKSKFKKSDKLKQTRKKYYLNNKEKIKKQIQNWHNKNKERVRELGRLQYHKNKHNIKFIIDRRMSDSIRKSLNKNKNGRNWEILVGYTLDDLIKHLQSKFSKGMTLEKLINGEIEIDHILPLELFEFKNSDEILFKICWSLKNLQPLWKNDNQLKNDFLPNGQRARSLTFEEKSLYIKNNVLN